MPDRETVQGWKNRKLVDSHGTRIGTISDLYLDIRSGNPEWAVVHGGLFGARTAIVPLSEAVPDGERVRVPYDKDQVMNAPHIPADKELSESEEAELYRHYGIASAVEGGAEEADRGEAAGGRGRTQAEGMATEMAARERAGGRETAPASETAPAGRAEAATPGTAAVDTPERTAAGAAPAGERTIDEVRPSTVSLLRSEEELLVRTRTRERGRARVRKYLVTEPESMTIPVRREELRVEWKPVTESDRTEAGMPSELTEDERDIILHEEEAVVEKRIVPKERVTLRTEIVTDERRIDTELRKERIELEEPDKGAGQRAQPS